MQSWKLSWGRNVIITKRQWVENQLLETEPDFIGFCGSVTKTAIIVHSKQLCISFSELWPEPCIGNLCCTSHIAFYWGPSKSLPLFWIWASAEARQTISFHSFMTEIRVTGYFASVSSSSHALFYATMPESQSSKVSTFYDPENIFLCPLSFPQDCPCAFVLTLCWDSNDTLVSSPQACNDRLFLWSWCGNLPSAQADV